MKNTLVIVASLFLIACEQNSDASIDTQEIKLEQIALGETVYKENCQICHGLKARGTVRDWKKRNSDGTLPPPPLNGTAHAWHHDQKTLLATVKNGGAPLGGTMPKFKNKLSSDEIIAVIEYLKNLWPEEVYQAWKERNG